MVKINIIVLTEGFGEEQYHKKVLIWHLFPLTQAHGFPAKKITRKVGVMIQ